ncbi:MAG: hypothetical protein N3J91_04215 [Verrucomicrobiae bacterium]|nr:hypothetical protein [Verrucomicrobiae bacterium]
MPGTSYTCLYVELKHLMAYIKLNGAPLYRDPNGVGLKSVRTVNEWIMPGKNQISTFWHWPTEVAYKPGIARANVSVFVSDPESTIPKPLHILAQHRWPMPDKPEAYPYESSSIFELPGNPPTRLWVDAEPLPDKLSPRDRQTALLLVEQLADAIERQNLDDIMVLVDYKIREDALANGHDLEHLRQSMREQYQFVLEEPGLKRQVLPADSLNCMVIGGNKLARVQQANWEEALIYHSESCRFKFDIYVAKIEGKWLIVR